MMSQGCQGIFRCRHPMLIRWRAHGRVADRRCIKRKQSVFADLVVIEPGNLHEEIMRMLAVIDRIAECRFTLLKQLRIETLGDCGGVKADHGPKRKLSPPA